MSPFDIHTTPPRLEPGSIERTQLLARLAQARHKTCLLVLGPAGSGKTSLVLQWRAQALAFGHDVAWLTAQPGDDGQGLLDPLFTSLDRVDPLIAREAHLLFNRGAGIGSPDVIAIALLRGLMARSRPLVLVLDDWQHVADPRAHGVVQTLLDFAPPQLRLVIVSRSVPPVSLARLRDQDAVMELDAKDLRFTVDEVQAFLHARHVPGREHDARRLLELTDGWAAGLQLVALGSHASASRVRNAQDFHSYFHREVLCRVDADALQAMTRLAAARGFDQALCAALAGEDAGPALLERLRREHLFVVPQDGAEREGWFRFHPLFRELLLERFEALPGDERRRTHATLAQWFAQRRQLRDAVHHGVAAGDARQAADWVDRWARELFLRGELQQLARAVSQLPREVVHARPSLMLWLGWTQLCYRQFSACHETLDALHAQQPQRREQRAHVCLLAFSLALQEDDAATAQRLLPEMLALPQGADAVLTGGRRNLLAWMYAHQGEYAQARAVLQGPVPLREDGSPLLDSAFGQLMGQAMLGLAWLFEGDVRHAEPVLREALAHAERRLGPYSEPACNAAAYLSAVLYEANDLPALRQLLEHSQDTIERVALPDAVVTIALVRARLRRFEGSPREALEGLERLMDLAQRRRLDRLLAFGLNERVRCLVQLGEAQAAREALQQLEVLAGRHADSSAPVSLRVAGLARHAAAVWHAARHDDRAALEALGERGRDDAPMVQRRDRCATQALRAMLLERLGEQDLALQVLRDTLLQAQQFGLVRTLLDLGDELLALAAACVRVHGEADPLLEFYVDRLREQAVLHRPAPPQPSAAQREPLSERETEVLRALAHSMSNKRIAQALGLSPETVKWHLRNVYAKLGVVGRDDAVARARDLGLVSA